MKKISLIKKNCISWRFKIFATIMEVHCNGKNNKSQINPIFNRPGPIHGIEVCVCMCVSVGLSPPHIFFLGLSLALRSHDQIPASHWRSKVECRNVDMQHNLMIPANILLCSSSRNIKEFQRDLRFRHSQTVLFTIPPNSVLY